MLRPLLYYRESEVRLYGQAIGLKPLKNPCPYDGHTKRQEMKELITKLDSISPGVYEHLAAAMREADQELWPSKPEQTNMLKLFRHFWQK